MPDPDDMSQREPIPPGKPPEGGGGDPGSNGQPTPPPDPGGWNQVLPMMMFTPGPSAYAARVVPPEQTGGPAMVLFRVEGTSGNTVVFWSAEEARKVSAHLLNMADEADKTTSGLIHPPRGLHLPPGVGEESGG